MSSSACFSQPRAPAWDAFDYLLAHQIRQACSISKPTIDIDDDDFGDIVQNLIISLTHGGSQKQVLGTVAPYLESPQQHEVFSELCSWMFSTQGVLSTLYQSRLSEYTAVGMKDGMLGIVGKATEREYRQDLSGFT